MSGDEFVLKSLDAGRGIETYGIKFYTEAYENVKDAKGRKTLQFLANEEKEHLRFINNLSQAFKEDASGKEIGKIIKGHKNLMENPKIFPGKEGYEVQIDIGDADKEILREAKKVEEKSIEFYKDCKNKVDKTEHKDIFETLVNEENKHVEWIEIMQGYMDVHGYWYDLSGYFANE